MFWSASNPLARTALIRSAVDAVRATPADTASELAEMDEDEAKTRRALELLGSRRNDAYEAALAALREDTRAWWERLLSGDPNELDEDEEGYRSEANDLQRFFVNKVVAWFETAERSWRTAAHSRASLRRSS